MSMQLLALCFCLFVIGCNPGIKEANSIPWGTPILHPDRTIKIVEVSGEVRQPGSYAWTDGMTAEAALAHAGGLTEFAWSRRLSIVRADGKTEGYQLGKDFRFEKEVTLHPGDRLHIHRQ